MKVVFLLVNATVAVAVAVVEFPLVWLVNNDGGCVMLVVVVEVVIGRVGRIGQGRMVGVEGLEVNVVPVDVVVVTDILGLFGCFLLIVSLQNDHTHRFIRNERKGEDKSTLSEKDKNSRYLA